MKHKHADLIKAWADGAQIQAWDHQKGIWRTCSEYMVWDQEMMYRIKPESKPEIQVDHHCMYLNLRFTVEKDGALMRFTDVELIK